MFTIPSGLLDDQYQYQMAYAAWHDGQQDDEAVFNLFFRKTPFGHGFAVACGMYDAIDYARRFLLDDERIAYMMGKKTPSGQPLYKQEFFTWLRHKITAGIPVEIHGMQEGTFCFPHESLIQVVGNKIFGMLLETPFLAIINHQTLIATKACRMVQAAEYEEALSKSGPVIEMGLRRAQGLESGTTGSRAAAIAGVAATSNLEAGFRWGLQTRGTHAHSWIMGCTGMVEMKAEDLDDESYAFRAFAHAFPETSVLLVDTFDTIAGIKKAMAIGKKLRAHGLTLSGIRLDSGDLCSLSQEARRMLNNEGFSHTLIIVSNDLDEKKIQSLRMRGACIDVWGVGTNLITGGEQSALGGVYKMVSVRHQRADGTMTRWHDTIKLSQDAIKVSIPGRVGIRRYVMSSPADNGRAYALADVIYDLHEDPADRAYDPENPQRFTAIPKAATPIELIHLLYDHGKIIHTWGDEQRAVDIARDHVRMEKARFHPALQRLDDPRYYPAGMSSLVHERREAMMRLYRGDVSCAAPSMPEDPVSP